MNAAGTSPEPDLAAFPYMWCWRTRTWHLPDITLKAPWFGDGVDRSGMRCRVLARGGMNSALVEFADGYRVVTSRGGLRKPPPEWGLTDHLCLSLDGEWVPGSIDGPPVFVAVFLEYLRRGGDAEPVGSVDRYQAWLDANAEPAFLAEVLRLARELQRLTESGADARAIGARLDPLVPILHGGGH